MPLPLLAAVADVEARLPGGVTIDPVRVSALLADASAAVRSYTKQDFSVLQSTDGVRPIGSRLRLPQQPVVSVESVGVVLPGSPPSSLVMVPGWYWDGVSNEVWLAEPGEIINLPEELAGFLLWRTPMYQVLYTHGYSPVPGVVVGVVCAMVIRVCTAPGGGGVVSESVGEYSYRLSDVAVQGPMMLSESEKEALNSYRAGRSSTVELRW